MNVHEQNGLHQIQNKCTKAHTLNNVKSPTNPVNLLDHNNVNTNQRNLTAHLQSLNSSVSGKLVLDSLSQGRQCSEVSATTQLFRQYRDPHPTRTVDFVRIVEEIIPNGSASLHQLHSVIHPHLKLTAYDWHCKLYHISLLQFTTTKRYHDTKIVQQLHPRRQAGTIKFHIAISFTVTHKSCSPST